MGATASIQIPAKEPVQAPAPDPSKFKKTSTGVAATDPNASTPPKETPNEEPQVERPDYIPEKFWTGNLEESTRKMAQSYVELERSKGSKPKEAPKEQPSGQQQETADQNTVEQLYAEATQEYADRGGSLSPEMYNKFQQAGISPRTVNDYITGREAANSLRRGQLIEVAGDEDALNAAIQWASQSLSAEEAEWYNQAFNGSSAKAAQRAMRSLIADFQENGAEPNLLSGEPSGDVGSSSRVHPFRSMDEQVKAQSDPRYKTDPAYRQEVDAQAMAVIRSGGYGNVRRR